MSSFTLREVCFLGFFDFCPSHLFVVAQFLAEVIQPIQAAEIQGQRATLTGFSHSNGGSGPQVLRKFGGQILGRECGS